VALGGMTGGGGTVGTGYVKIKPDAAGFGTELEQQVGKEAGSASSGIGDKAGRAFQGAFLAGTATLAKGVFDFAGFDAGMREIFTLMPGISGAAMEDMTAQVKDFSAEFGVLPTETVPALYEALGAGVPADNVFEFLEQAQMLAKGGATDLATAVDGLSSVTNAYGADVVSAAQASDIMFKTVALGKGTVDEVAGSLFQVTPIAAAMGVAFEDVGGALATLTAQGTPVSVASTQIRGVIAELGKDGTKASDVFKDMAGQTFPEFIASGGDLAGALGLMQQAADENGVSLIDMFGSIEAGQAALGLMKGGGEAFVSAVEQMENSAGSSQAAFETMNEGLAATMDKLKARFAVTLLNLGETLAPMVESVGMALAGLLDIFTSLPGPMQTMIVVAGTLAAGLIGFAGPILKAVQLFKMLGSAMTLLAANPIVLVVLGIAAAAYLIIKNWDTVRAFLEETWQVIQDAAGAVADWFTETWDSVSSAVTGAWDAMYEGIAGVLSSITGAISGAWTTIVDTVTGAVSAVGSVISGGFELVRGAFELYLGIYRTIFETAWTAIRTVVETVWGAISAVVTTAVGTVRTIIEGAWTAITAVTSSAWNGLKVTIETIGGGVVGFITGIPGKITGAFSGLASLISAPFTAAFGAIKTGWNATVGGFGFTTPSWIPGLGGKSFTIPSMATGGVAFDPMLAQIGDAGSGDPEIVSPVSLMRETVIAALSEGGGSGGGLVIEGPLIGTAELRDTRDAVELSRELYREIDRRQKASGVRTSTVGALA
jgi:TP901 family phage tail tape measure protein